MPRTSQRREAVTVALEYKLPSRLAFRPLTMLTSAPLCVAFLPASLKRWRIDNALRLHGLRRSQTLILARDCVTVCESDHRDQPAGGAGWPATAWSSPKPLLRPESARPRKLTGRPPGCKDRGAWAKCAMPCRRRSSLLARKRQRHPRWQAPSRAGNRCMHAFASRFPRAIPGCFCAEQNVCCASLAQPSPVCAHLWVRTGPENGLVKHSIAGPRVWSVLWPLMGKFDHKKANQLDILENSSLARAPAAYVPARSAANVPSASSLIPLALVGN